MQKGCRICQMHSFSLKSLKLGMQSSAISLQSLAEQKLHKATYLAQSPPYLLYPKLPDRVAIKIIHHIESLPIGI